MGLVIGITGGIATGKTTLAKCFEKWGAILVEADRIGWELLAKADIYQNIIDKFGEKVSRDGRIDRKELGKVIFSDRKKREEFNKIVHPPLLKIMKQTLEELKEKHPESIIVVDAALIVEWSISDLFDAIVVVTSKKETQIRRLGLSRKEAIDRIDAQLPHEEKVQYADYVVKNDGTIEEFKKKIKTLWEEINTRKH